MNKICYPLADGYLRSNDYWMDDIWQATKNNNQNSSGRTRSELIDRSMAADWQLGQIFRSS